MQAVHPSPDALLALQEVLGYLNFSTGTPDPKFLASLNLLQGQIESRPPLLADRPLRVLKGWLTSELERLEHQSATFSDISQARNVLELTLDALLPAYRRYHRDLLFHQDEQTLFNPFFLGRAFEAVLVQGGPWDEQERILAGAIDRLNDYLGYRPVAVLESQKVEPYDHEWVRPIPLFVPGAGVAAGRYQQLIARTLEILGKTDPQLLAQAWFNPAAIEELALDPRAYDFDHPVNRRPNYHFGHWDPHKIDNRGNYRRFVLQQVALDALLSRVPKHPGPEQDEFLFEAAAVLAGTMLMASGTSGSGPSTHDSNVRLATLLPHIASYRDEFYRQLLENLSGPAAERLLEESRRLRQPFGGARQHLNQELARLRATQLQHVHLAQLYARMGYPEAATRQAHTVQVAGARMLCQMYCRLTLGHRAIDSHALEQVAEYLPEIEDLLHRAIECGALVDPWNIVGFGGNFSLFPAIENSIRDYRVDTLIELMEQIFALCARGWSEAAAQDNAELESQFSSAFDRLASWWDQFATSSVQAVKRLVGKELQISTNLVAGALNAWHKAGAAAGDIAFWRMFVEQFDSPKAFQLVVEALLEKQDHVASLALLMQWLSQAPRVPLEDGDSSFHRLAVRWVYDVERYSEHHEEEAWRLIRKFFDYLEANAEDFWLVPKLDLAGIRGGGSQPAARADDLSREVAGDLEDEEDEDRPLFSAAYEEMTYRDSTDDGVEGDMLEQGGAGSTEFELQDEAKRIGERLAFLTTLAKLWKYVASVWGAGAQPNPKHQEAFQEWQTQAAVNHAGLLRLLESVHGLRLPKPSGDHDSLVEYDRRRMLQESLLERIIATNVETTDAVRVLLAVSGDRAEDHQATGGETIRLLRAVLGGDSEQVRALWPTFLRQLNGESILYVPLSKGGSPCQIVSARTLQQTLRDLLVWLPRLGLIRETCELLQAAQDMESEHPVGPGAVTEFDRLFETGYKGIVECIVASAETWDLGEIPGRAVDGRLVECLQDLTESQLKRWLRHSRTLRLSVVEKLAGEAQWQHFVEFVERYGHNLFTQKFLNLGNVRGILHQGIDAWLHSLEENPDADENAPLLEILAQQPNRAELVKHLGIALEAVVENYAEYRDYNSTTTQSDRGELLYMLIDFLRLRAEYDRVAWNLRPVVLAHEIVVRRGRTEAAEMWRRALAERTREAADRHLERLNRLSQAYGMRLPTIADRMAERFVRPLAIDRVRSLVRPAMEDAHGDEHTIFSLLEQELDELGREPTGVGFDLPAWLEALEDEVTTVRQQQRQGMRNDDLYRRIPQARLTLESMLKQLEDIAGMD